MRATRAEAKHHLYRGELSDAPGRKESWDEYVRYLGSSRWLLLIAGSNFDGCAAADRIAERMSTRALLSWVVERDAEDREDDGHSNSDDESERTLGPRGERLREIAADAGADYCLLLISQYLSGQWPRERATRILSVVGKVRRTIWRGVSHEVFEVATDRGPAYLYRPSEDGYAKLVFKSEGSMSQGRQLRISTKLRGLLKLLEGYQARNT